MYLALCQNDQEDPIPPLYCTLRTRVSLASQYAYLLSAAAEGRGHSEIQAHLRYEITDEGDSDESGTITAESEEPTNGETTDHTNGENANLGEEGHLTNASEGIKPTDAKEEEDQQVAAPEEAKDRSPLHPELPKEESLEGHAVVLGAQEEGENYENYEGESDISSNLCVKPKVCFCESCLANTSADQGPEENADEETTESRTLGGAESSDPLVDGDSSNVGDLPHEATSGAENLAAGGGVAVNDFALPQNDHPASPPSQGDDTGNPVTDPAEHVSSIADQVATTGHIQGAETDLAVEEPEVNNNDQFVDSDKALTALKAAVSEGHEDSVDNPGLISSEVVHTEPDFSEEEIDLGDDDDLVSIDDGTASNGASTKRKLIDDDDFNFLDPATPEKKKSRPST